MAVTPADAGALTEAAASGWKVSRVPKASATATTRAVPPAPVFDAIPPALRERTAWILWKRETRDGKITKVPYQAREPGRRASTTNPATWADFETARAAYEAWREHGIDGIGFVFSDADPFVGIDVDHARDPATGELDRAVIDQALGFGSYAEYSQSGDGIHVIAIGRKPGADCRKGNAEMYATGRYFVMTGRRIDGTPDDVTEPAPGTIEAFYETIARSPAPMVNPAKKVSVKSTVMDDDEVIERARGANNGAKFSALFDAGSTAGYPSHSEAEAALCALLRFWTQDPYQMDRIFRRSGLMRPKWDTKRGRSTYGMETIDRAIGLGGEVYTPRRAVLPYRSGAAAPTVETGENLERRAVREEALAQQCATFNPTDIGNGQRFAARFAESVKHCRPRKAWLEYDGARWAEDRTGEIRERAKEAARAINREVAIEVNDGRRRELAKWARDSESESRLSAMLAMASTDPAIRVLPEVFDAAPDFFNVENGTFNLKTLELQPHRREDLLTKMAGTYYDPAATCPLWLDHLALIFGGNQAMIDAFQMRCGYYLLSGNPQQIFDIWWGSGENGKSVTLTMIRRTFGTYAHHASADSFMETKRDGTGPRSDLVALRGARLVTAAESDKKKRLAEGLIKSLTGGDPLTVRALFAAEETFVPEFAPVLATNNDPDIRGVEHAIWRRIKKWPFTVAIPEEKKIPYYENRLEAELPGILAWAIEGLRRYYAAGERLDEPAPVKESTAAYRASMDLLNPFIVERCTVKAGAVCNRTDLSAEYQKWCADNGEEKMLPRDFYRALEEHGWGQRRTKAGRFFHGIRIKTPKEQADYEKEAEAREESYQSNLAKR